MAVPVLLTCTYALLHPPLLVNPTRTPRSIVPLAIAGGGSVPNSDTAAADVQRSTNEEERPPYFISGWSRPRYRGSTVRWLHKTRVWYIISAAYVLAASQLPTPPLFAKALALRMMAAVVTSFNVFVSHGYHNADRRRGAQLTADAELAWLKWDYWVISWILTYNIWLWASNFGWSWRHVLNLVTGGATVLTGAFARLATLNPVSFGHLGAIGTMAAQFFVPLCYLMVATPPAALIFVVFGAYGAGLAAWALRQPKHELFGYHELFHLSVVAGHLTSMVCDLVFCMNR